MCENLGDDQGFVFDGQVLKGWKVDDPGGFRICYSIINSLGPGYFKSRI